MASTELISVIEIYTTRFAAGAESQLHEHLGTEAFLVLEVELQDCDGTLFQAGDFVTYLPQSRHYSVSPQGCTLLVILHGGRNQPLGGFVPNASR